MLVLTRKMGSTLMIGDEITVTVTSIEGNGVEIGINAPRNIPIHRAELYHRLHGLDGNRSDDAWIYTAPKAVLRLLSKKLRSYKTLNH